MMKPNGAVLFLAIFLPALVQAEQFQINGRTFVVPDGLTIELVASSPLVDRPIVADIDEKGRLYVADSSGSNDNVQVQLNQRPHKIVRLEDTDGDGKYDKRTIFADKMMFPEGAMWLDGSLYVSAPPSIWKLTDTDGDGVADRRVEWFQGKTLTGCANDLHGPYRGPDGWIYWAKGAFAEQTYPTLNPKKPLVTKASHLFRSRPDGTGIEAVMTGGMDNPVDVVFTPEGERLFTTTFLVNPAGGQRDGIIHAIYGGVYGKIHNVIDGHPRTRPEMMPTLVHLGPAAPAGLHRYESNALGDKYRDNIFACQFNLRKVSRHVLIPDGASFKTQDSDLVSSPDQDFHPTDVIEDFDGSVLVVDTGGWYKLCCPTSQLSKPDVLGAVYRIKPKWQAGKHSAEIHFAGLEQSTSRQLAEKLNTTDAAIRRRASDLLVKRADAIEHLALANTPHGRLATVWLASRIEGEPARAFVRTALKDSLPAVRHAACHAVSVRRDRKALVGLTELVASGDVAVRRAAAEAIGRLGGPESETFRSSMVTSLLTALASAEDRTLEHSLTYAIMEIGAWDSEVVRQGLGLTTRRERRATLVALDQLGDKSLVPGLVASEFDSNDKLSRQSAAWIISRHPEWSGELVSILKGRLGSVSEDSAEAPELVEVLVQLAGEPKLQEMLAKAIESGKNPSMRHLALDAMRLANLKTVPAGWIAAIRQQLGQKDQEDLNRLFDTVRAWPVVAGKEGDDLAKAMLDAAERLPDDRKLLAFASIPGGLKSVGKGRLKLLLAHLSTDLPVAERLLAADTLSKSRLTREELIQLTESLKTAGPLEVAKLLSAFESSKDEEVGKSLVMALGKSSAKASLRPDTLKPLLAKYGPGALAAGQPLLDSLNVDAGKQRERIEAMMVHLKDGDVRRGQLVFNGTKAACRTCHTAGYVGGKVGPDLTRIGSTRNERDLLEAILYPSLSFVRSYEPVLIETRDGKSVSGILKKDAVDEVILAINANEEVRIPRAQIEEMRPGNVSVMPAGLDQQLTPQELADLVTFLRASK